MMRRAPGSAATRGVHPRLRGGERSRIPGRTRRWVHPRLRGGEAWLTTLASSAEGSSPPARGRVDVGADGVLHRGFIPACAGESTPRASPGRARWVHPRLRGGAHRGIFVSDSTPGSSPPARGRADLPPKPLKLPGFIPACAGERYSPAGRAATCGVHPRLRGGEGMAWRKRGETRGSSPPARGREPAQHRRPLLLGFIPACAGERPSSSSCVPSRRVHPRLRGGELAGYGMAEPELGSSPPARGRVPGRQVAERNSGFIPACAGESVRARNPGNAARVHPRLRGGEFPRRCRADRLDGSSPPARGRGCPAQCRRVQLGFIPACAGERVPRSVSAGSTGVHPRLRGGEVPSNVPEIVM